MGFFNFFKKKNDDNLLLFEQQVDQKIFNILRTYLPSEWLEIVFFAGYYKEDSGYFKYWVKTKNGQYIDCFNLISEPNPSEKDKLQEQLMQIHKELQLLRIKLTSKQKWACLEMHVSNQGELTKTYDYADGIAKENLQSYIEDYKNKLNEKLS